MNSKNKIIIGLVIFFVVAGAAVIHKNSQKSVDKKQVAENYNPVINPADFVSHIDNKYFTLKLGTIFTYRESTKDGVEEIKLVVTHNTKKIMGVTTIAVQDTAWINDKLKEDTTDYYVQDKVGNVWYFGEVVNNYDDGVLRDHNGSWEAGVDGALPGIIMQANPKIGDSYRQEYYKGKAEDMADNMALGQTVSVPYGTFDNCLQTRDWSRTEPTLNEYKYYCPTVGFLVAGDSVKEPGQEKLELLSVSTQ